MGETNRPLSVAFEEAENAGSNESANPTLGDIISARLSRRDLARGLLAVSVVGTAVSPLAIAAAGPARAGEARATRFAFPELPVSPDDETHHVAEGYDADVLIRWGDKVLPGAPEFEPEKLTAEGQSKQFGYNNDFLGFVPLDGSSDHGLLVVNHEYTNGELMFRGVGPRSGKDSGFEGVTREMTEVEMMAHGGSVLEVKRTDGKWAVVLDSKYARRITAETEIRISGPAAGHELMKTSADPTGTKVRGMLNNCAGGVTPWGTWLTCEENINGYFWGKAAAESLTDAARALRRYGIPGEWYAWGKFHDRFDVEKEPNEPNRFGWVVEIDPLDPTSTPVKRTAMGRFKHEGAGNIVNHDGRFVVYQGDDERFDYVYRFVTDGKVDLVNRAANKDLLDTGTLFVARFNADGTGVWLPLVHGQGDGWLTEKFGFATQADVLIHTRLAADLVGATKMDRPEDVEVNPETGRVYVMLTNNTKRKPEQVNPANPRANNAFGHIVEITPDGGDHSAPTFKWEILLKCGDPAIADVGATFSPATTRNGWFGMPDNCAVDALGRLWVASGSRPTATRPRKPAAQTESGPSKPRERDGAPRAASSRFRAGPRCAGPISRPTSRPSSSPCSTRARPTTMRRAPSPRPSTGPRRAGPTSRTVSLRARASSPSRGRAAARSARRSHYPGACVARTLR